MYVAEVSSSKQQKRQPWRCLTNSEIHVRDTFPFIRNQNVPAKFYITWYPAWIGVSAVCSDSRPSNSSSFLLSWDCSLFVGLCLLILETFFFSSFSSSLVYFLARSLLLLRSFFPSSCIQKFLHSICHPHLLPTMWRRSPRRPVFWVPVCALWLAIVKSAIDMGCQEPPVLPNWWFSILYGIHPQRPIVDLRF